MYKNSVTVSLNQGVGTSHHPVPYISAVVISVWKMETILRVRQNSEAMAPPPFSYKRNCCRGHCPRESSRRWLPKQL